VFSVWYLREPLKGKYLVGFGLMVGAVFMIVKEWSRSLQLAPPLCVVFERIMCPSRVGESL
jgi:hypothetical protein